MNEGPLIQAEDLAERLEDTALRIFDCRFDLARADAPADLDGGVRESSRQPGDCRSVAL